jgi:transposase
VSGLEALTKEELISIILELHAQIEVLKAEIEELRSQLPGTGAKAVPDWVKPNRQERRADERKKRKQSFVRRRQTPTEVHLHASETCPDCGRKLAGGWVHRRRQVIEIPLTPVRIIEHVVVARHCGVCGKRVIPNLDLSGEVVGTHRVGIRLMSLVAYLHNVCRTPLRTIKKMLDSLYGLKIGLGELSEILHTVAHHGQGEYESLRDEIRGSPCVNADETGWREEGENGYVWSFSTPSVRYFTYNKSRSGQVAKEVLSEEFEGVVVSDFYCGYNILLGLHQRCWVHLFRDLDKLVEKHPEDESVAEWAKKIRDIYWKARSFSSNRQRDRLRQKMIFQEELYELARPYLKVECPQRILAERIERFLPELFTFVEYPDVPSENNAAERAVRPLVIARKVSGGTRSDKGSKTRMTLMSLFSTWAAQGLDQIEECQKMLIGQSDEPAATNLAVLSHAS